MKAIDHAVPTPFGTMRACIGDGQLVALDFAAGDFPSEATAPRDAAVLEALRAQLDAWCAGRLAIFDLPLAAQGTPFQRAVWERARAIPFGQTCSYAALAAALGRPRAVRAVGTALGRNPWLLVVPCHRVLGSGGGLCGYAGGVERKRALLAFEARVAMKAA